MTTFSSKIWNFCKFLLTSAKSKQNFSFFLFVFKITYKEIYPCKNFSYLPFLFRKKLLLSPNPHIHQTSIKKPIHNRVNSIFTKRVTSSRQCLVEVTSNIILTNMLFCNHFHDILRIFDNLPNFPWTTS